MTKKLIGNIAASVHQKLSNKAKQTNRPFIEILRYYTIERYLYRLTKSIYADKFILKGGLMFAVWNAPMSRPTRDLDLLGRLDNDVKHIVKIAKAICRQPVEPDGVHFDPATVAGESIIEDAEYTGVRIKLVGKLGTTRLPMQMDVGFGDVVYPASKVITYPTLIDSPAPHIQGYSRESVIAEKFHIMVKQGMFNSRMKDFYDMWLLSRQFDFKGKSLAEAISKTFSHRGTSILPGFSKGFSSGFNVGALEILKRFAKDEAKANQWRGFLRKHRLDSAPENLEEVVKAIKRFIKPITLALAAKKPFDRLWKAPGPWR